MFYPPQATVKYPLLHTHLPNLLPPTYDNISFRNLHLTARETLLADHKLFINPREWRSGYLVLCSLIAQGRWSGPGNWKTLQIPRSIFFCFKAARHSMPTLKAENKFHCQLFSKQYGSKKHRYFLKNFSKGENPCNTPALQVTKPCFNRPAISEPPLETQNDRQLMRSLLALRILEYIKHAVQPFTMCENRQIRVTS